jgi:hypothetical protein
MSVHDCVTNVVQVWARMPSLPDDKHELEEKQEYTCLLIRALFAGNPISISRSSPVTHRHPHDFHYNRSHKPRLTHGCLFASGHHGLTVDTFERERCSLVSVLSVV